MPDYNPEYSRYFKHLRVLKGLHGLSGTYIVEAVTPDGRVLTATARGRKGVQKVLEDWVPHV